MTVHGHDPSVNRSATLGGSRRSRIRRALHTRIVLAGLLGVTAAFLVACGSSGKGLIPSANAGPLQSDFEAVAQAAQGGEGSCTATQAAIAKTVSDFAALPSSVDAGLRKRLSGGISDLRSSALALCAQPLPQATSTTKTTAPTTTTNTQPTTPTTTRTETDTTPTTPTTPPTKAPTPGGGTPGPGEENEPAPSNGAGGGTGIGGEESGSARGVEPEAAGAGRHKEKGTGKEKGSGK